MASFQAKIGWKGGEKEKIKIIVLFRSRPTRKNKLQKNRKNKKKIKKIPLWLHFRRKKVGKGGEREKIKINVLFRSYPTRKNKLQKNRKNIQKIKNTIVASFQAKIGWKRLRKRGNKNHRSVPFLPDVLEKIPKK